ncbi:MAG: SRPBCC family protein [Planctomycetota bacterium]
MVVLYSLLAVLATVVVIGLLLPTQYSVSCVTSIDAPSPAVHAYVGHLDRWPEWMPWEQEDPSIVTSRSEQSTGVGARQSWTSAKAGDGEVEFTECDEDTGIAYDMAFLMKDRRAPSKASIRYAPDGDATRVTWTMEGDMVAMMPRVIAGWFRILMVRMIGKQFGRGLASLKGIVEAA